MYCLYRWLLTLWGKSRVFAREGFVVVLVVEVEIFLFFGVEDVNAAVVSWGYFLLEGVCLMGKIGVWGGELPLWVGSCV